VLSNFNAIQYAVLYIYIYAVAVVVVVVVLIYIDQLAHLLGDTCEEKASACLPG
jgi:hypothetical protein